MTEAEKERIKYLATLLNTCAAACFTVGVAAPIAAALYSPTPAVKPLFFIVGAFSWLCAASILHLSVRRILGRLT